MYMYMYIHMYMYNVYVHCVLMCIVQCAYMVYFIHVHVHGHVHRTCTVHVYDHRIWLLVKVVEFVCVRWRAIPLPITTFHRVQCREQL